MLFRSADRRAATDVGSVDLTLGYDPPGGADRFRLFWRTQALGVDRADDGAPGGHLRQLGGYTYVNAHLDARFEAGARADLLSGTAGTFGDALDRKQVEIAPYLTFWQSEFVRLRLEYRHDQGDLAPKADLVVLQLDGAVGPHSHDKY